MYTVKLKCTNNNNVVSANLVHKNDSNMKVHIPTGDIVLVLVKTGSVYVGKRAGLEFTCDGKLYSE